ncbi:MAG: TetR/AcrR family transcriptional regulator [Mesorhizobium sp.]|nr:TetR family transcriptional regulator [bacterium M00.F.Ca.ET.205.01.1.1]TGU54415.1 TetR family transcriptional regulator [bacterium M00.F.Ca.ET.152.01.1.1]TGV38795.1 TetR family transcriptional regulator [Mesorhizobium sp. M00.F.Ca.ET.186.01.1.1]TGZ43988.1 TetR family transcriptional regulator [bacterium M00.F.Ca.ET.162.01.1.1]TIW59588.1 MAG: TetR/AcrR family transcriptional regulator [Mesorhizobium sp.]
MAETTSGADNESCADLLDTLRRGRPAAGQDPVKRSQIIEGARRVFIEKGFEAASMNDITREAGVSKGTIYVYFANKEELFEALIEEERGTIFKNMYEVLDRADDLRQTMTKFGKVLALKITSTKVMQAQRTVIGAADRMPELGARFFERGPKRGHDRMVTFLNAAIERGLLRIDDVDLAAYQFTDLCLAGLFRQCIFAYRAKAPSQEEIDHIVRSGVDIFLKAYGTESLAAEESHQMIALEAKA